MPILSLVSGFGGGVGGPSVVSVVPRNGPARDYVFRLDQKPLDVRIDAASGPIVANTSSELVIGFGTAFNASGCDFADWHDTGVRLDTRQEFDAATLTSAWHARLEIPALGLALTFSAPILGVWPARLDPLTARLEFDSLALTCDCVTRSITWTALRLYVDDVLRHAEPARTLSASGYDERGNSLRVAADTGIVPVRVDCASGSSFLSESIDWLRHETTGGYRYRTPPLGPWTVDRIDLTLAASLPPVTPCARCDAAPAAILALDSTFDADTDPDSWTVQVEGRLRLRDRYAVHQMTYECPTLYACSDGQNRSVPPMSHIIEWRQWRTERDRRWAHAFVVPRAAGIARHDWFGATTCRIPCEILGVNPAGPWDATTASATTDAITYVTFGRWGHAWDREVWASPTTFMCQAPAVPIGVTCVPLNGGYVGPAPPPENERDVSCVELVHHRVCWPVAPPCPPEVLSAAVNMDAHADGQRFRSYVTGGVAWVGRRTRGGAWADVSTGIAADWTWARIEQRSGVVRLWLMYTHGGAIFERVSVDYGRTVGMPTTLGTGRYPVMDVGEDGTSYVYWLTGSAPCSVHGLIRDRAGNVLHNGVVLPTTADDAPFGMRRVTGSLGGTSVRLLLVVGGVIREYGSSDGRNFT